MHAKKKCIQKNIAVRGVRTQAIRVTIKSPTSDLLTPYLFES
jgi:hypothetical protein